ncbi:MAG: hypothetical protein QW607_08940, partial [Desulfurococcaceae archaeon]
SITSPVIESRNSQKGVERSSIISLSISFDIDVHRNSQKGVERFLTSSTIGRPISKRNSQKGVESFREGDAYVGSGEEVQLSTGAPGS